MKKIIIFIIPFILTGCFDYIELTDLAIISGITISKSYDEFEISFEILNDEAKGDKTNKNQSLIVSGTGKTITSAINNTFKSTPKKPYLSHIKALVLSNNIDKDEFKEIASYFLRSPDIRNEFFLMIYDGDNAKDIFNIVDENIPVASDYIYKMINNNSKSSNNINTKNFEQLLIEVFEKGKDAVIPVINYENNLIRMSGIALMDNYDTKKIIKSDDTMTYNLLDGKVSDATYTFNCPNSNKTISITIYDKKVKYEIRDDYILINAQLQAEIDEYNCNMNLKSVDTINKLNDYYSDIYRTKIYEFYDELKANKTDSLGVGKLLYNKRRTYNEDDWISLEEVVKVDLKINKEGLIFGVTNGN